MDKKIILEMWKTWNYCYTISVPLFLIILTALYYLDYKLGFWILLIVFGVSVIGSSWRMSKLDKMLLK